MVKKLAAQGLVDHARYGAIRLTDAGRQEALRMVRRHRLIETWLVERCGFAWHEVHDEAEVLEHAMSDRLLDELDRQLGHPTSDPHGDPIPDVHGRVDRPDAVPLAQLSDGRALVARVSDRDPEMLRELTRGGVSPGSIVSAGSLAAAATAIWVIPLDD